MRSRAPRPPHAPTRAAARAVALAVALALALAFGTSRAAAQRPNGLTPEQRAHREQVEHELDSLAVVERKVMLPMRDGLRMAADVYHPKNVARAPAIFMRTPYNFNFWDVRNGAPRDMSLVLHAIRNGYAWVDMNERGHFFSEGNYDILGPPRTDGQDAIEWVSSQPWSNGKVGLLGCSSTAEWQMGVAAMAPKGLAAINPQGFGAGVGRVAPYFEQGNWYRGGAVQMLFIGWLYGEQNQVRPMFPANTPQADLVRASRAFDLAQQLPPVDWAKAFFHLPEKDIIEAVGGPHGIFADSMPGIATGGAMIQRTPNDPAWYRGGLFHDDMKIDVPGLWFMSWYDVSVGPNLATYNFVRRTASPEIGKEQWAIIAPTLHCAYSRSTENTVVGERSVGDARFDFVGLTMGFFDRFLKGEPHTVLDTTPRVRYFTMGINRWQSSDSWPPAGARPVTYFLGSAGKANAGSGEGVLSATAPSSDRPDAFTYDPMNPVPSTGGNVCCQPGLDGGAMDQQKLEARPDILVYTSEPLKQGVEVSGPVTATLYVSSDAKDTDFTVKFLDVYPDGRAYNLDETIQRARYREGYDRQVFMQPGRVYKVTLSPMNTSNWFEAGHRIRIEVSSSNFPRFDRNLNTGGRNYDEATGVVAHNLVHHSKQYPSQLVLTVVPGAKPPPVSSR